MKSDVTGLRTRLALVNGLRYETSADLYEDIAGRLRARGIEVEAIHSPEGPTSTFCNYDLLISNMDVPAVISAGIRAYTGRAMSRPSSLRLLAEFSVPTMEWTLARTRHDVVEGEIAGGETAGAVLAGKAIAQIDVIARKSGPPVEGDVAGCGPCYLGAMGAMAVKALHVVVSCTGVWNIAVDAFTGAKAATSGKFT